MDLSVYDEVCWVNYYRVWKPFIAGAVAALGAAAQAPVTEGSIGGARDFPGLPAPASSNTFRDLTPSAAAVSASVARPLGTQGLRYTLHFETQNAKRCGRHALNNALGGEVLLQNSDLTEACDVVIAESFIPDDNGCLSDPQSRADHELANGWYSEAVLAMALRRTMQYRLLLQPLSQNPHILADPAIAGAIVNKDNEHWVALKRVDGHIWLLDSCHTPVVLTDDAYLAFIRAHKHSYPVERL